MNDNCRTIHQHVDARGLDCPLPVLRAKQALTELKVGEILEVLASDPHTIADFRIFCERTDHRLVSESTHEGEFRFLIEKGAA